MEAIKGAAWPVHAYIHWHGQKSDEQREAISVRSKIL